MTKTVHNIRIRAILRSNEARAELAEAIENWLEFPIREYLELDDLRSPGLDTLYTLKLWFDKQPQVRAILGKLNEDLSIADKQILIESSDDRIDHDLNFRLKLDKDALRTAACKLLPSGSGVDVRLKLAVFPKTREGANKLVENVFTHNL